MTEFESPEIFYNRRIEDISVLALQLKQKRTIVSWARVLLIVLFVYLVIAFWSSGISNVIIAVLPVLIIFGFLVAYMVGLDDKILHHKLLTKINQEELAALQNRYPSTFDGDRYLTQLGSSGNDLDIFGHSALYPFVNRAFTEPGRNIMASFFVDTPAAKENIIAKQLAVKELLSQVTWR